MEKAPEVVRTAGTLCGAAHRIQQSGADVHAAGGGGFLGGTAVVDRFVAREDFHRAIQNRLFCPEQSSAAYWCNWYSNPYLLRRLSAIYEAEPAFPYAGDVVETIRRALPPAGGGACGQAGAGAAGPVGAGGDHPGVHYPLSPSVPALFSSKCFLLGRGTGGKLVCPVGAGISLQCRMESEVSPGGPIPLRSPGPARHE